MAKKADAALSLGNDFSLDEAEAALSVAFDQYLRLMSDRASEREKQLKRDNENCALLLEKSAQVAAVKWELGKALSLHARQLNYLIASHGRESINLVACYDNMGAIALDFGRAAEAEKFYRRVAEIMEYHFGRNDLQTAKAYGNLGFSIGAQGRPADAEPFLLEALEIQKRHLGESHIDVGYRHGTLGTNLMALGRAAEAAATFVPRLYCPWGSVPACVNLAETCNCKGSEFMSRYLTVARRQCSNNSGVA